MKAFTRFVLAAGTLLGASINCLAADWVVAQVAPFSGPMAQVGNDLRAGATIAINAINAKGGVSGRKLKLVTDDDQNNAELTAKKMNDLIGKEKPIALFGTGDADTTDALVNSKLLERNGLPLVGPRTGANSVINSNSSQVFVTRASYVEEVSAILRHCQVSGISSIAIVYQEDAFGRDLLATVEKAAPSYKITIAAKAPYKGRLQAGATVDRGDARESVSAVVNRPHQALLVAADLFGAVGVASGYRAGGGIGTIMTLSTNDGESLAQRGGLTVARGIWVSQVVPAPRNEGIPLVRRFINDLKAGGADAADIPDMRLTSTMLEGYVSMLVLIEGLKRAGPAADGGKLTSAIQGIRDLDLGGFAISFGGPTRSGSKFVEMGVISAAGQVLR